MTLSQQRAQIARATLAAMRDPAAQPRLDDLRREYREGQLAEHILTIADAAPPLAADQRRRLAGLLLASASA